MNIIRIDKSSGYNHIGVAFNSASVSADNNIRGMRSQILLVVDREYDKYLKRVNNRNKLYNKLKKLGRKI